MIHRGLTSTVLAHVMDHRGATTNERMYIHLFNRQRTDDRVREAMQSAMGSLTKLLPYRQGSSHASAQ
jgi:hypothetical protein